MKSRFEHYSQHFSRVAGLTQVVSQVLVGHVDRKFEDQRCPQRVPGEILTLAGGRTHPPGRVPLCGLGLEVTQDILCSAEYVPSTHPAQNTTKGLHKLRGR